MVEPLRYHTSAAPRMGFLSAYSGAQFARHRSWVFALAVLLLSSAIGSVVSQGPQPAVTQTSDREQLTKLHSEAVSLLKRAAQNDLPIEERRTAVRNAVQRLESLAVEPEARGSAPGFSLPLPLRAELRGAARELASAAGGGPERLRAIDTSRYLALLERVRSQLQGEIALGLTLQGSYSQSKPKEAAYGGHATAMGPPPADGSLADDTAPSPATFEEPARLAARTYCGGPTKDHILESACGGVALVDYDGDGRLDIYLVTAAELSPARERIPHRNVLYRNLGGWKFEDVSKKAGVDAAAWGSGVCAGDVDGDGRVDLYVTNWGPNLLYRNRGDGSFEEIAAPAGVAAGGWSTGCSFFDADADGDLDLYVARYVDTTWDSVVRAQRTLVWRNGPRIMIGPAGLPGESDLFFENVGSGRFVEAAEKFGLADTTRAYGFAVVATDYDDDGLVDLFVANDSNPNFLYHNLGNGRFESVGLLAGVAVNGQSRAQAGMGADSGDYDGDGRLDIVLTSFAHDNDTLYRNIDGRQFEDASVPSRIATPTFARMGWGIGFFDADLDGKLDLFVANGHIFADIDNYPQLGETYRQKNQLLVNVGTGFRDVSTRAGAGLQVSRVGRSLALGDLDDDGDADVIVSNVDDAPTLLENRQSTGHHWAAFRVLGPSGNHLAIGAKVVIEAGGKKQVREIRSGGTYLAQSDLRPLFGLGNFAAPIRVEVRMPGGRRWQWPALQVDRVHVLDLTESPDAAKAGGNR